MDIKIVSTFKFEILVTCMGIYNTVKLVQSEKSIISNCQSPVQSEFSFA